MPDGRLRDSKGYSTHPPTARSRKRLANLSPEKLEAHKSRSAECSAIWSACARVSKTERYKKVNVNHRRAMLLQHIAQLLGKRETAGKTRVGVNEETIVEKHLKREATERKFCKSLNRPEYNVSLKGISVDQRDEESDGDSDVELSDQELDDDPLPFYMNIAPGTYHQSHANLEILQELKKMNRKLNNLYCFLGSLHTHSAGLVPLSAPRDTMDSPMVPSDSEQGRGQIFGSRDLIGQGYGQDNTSGCHATSNEPNLQDNVRSHDNEQTQSGELVDPQSATGFYAQTSLEMQAQQQTNPLGSHTFLSMAGAQTQPLCDQQIARLGGFGMIAMNQRPEQQMNQQAPHQFEALARGHLSRRKSPGGS